MCTGCNIPVATCHQVILRIQYSQIVQIVLQLFINMYAPAHIVVGIYLLMLTYNIHRMAVDKRLYIADGCLKESLSGLHRRPGDVRSDEGVRSVE